MGWQQAPKRRAGRGRGIKMRGVYLISKVSLPSHRNTTKIVCRETTTVWNLHTQSRQMSMKWVRTKIRIRSESLQCSSRGLIQEVAEALIATAVTRCTETWPAFINSNWRHIFGLMIFLVIIYMVFQRWPTRRLTVSSILRCRTMDWVQHTSKGHWEP